VYDYCVIGAGIVGLATALAILENDPKTRIVVLEKETVPGWHQTGHNSGVIHSGIYYSPGSLSADLCARGAEETKRFADENAVPFIECGKLIVATNMIELARLEAFRDTTTHSSISVEWLKREALRQAEPHVSGLAALRVKETSIIDYCRVCDAMVARLIASGAEVKFSRPASAIYETESRVTVWTGTEKYDAQHLVVCGGLQADRLARMAGLSPDLRIVPFRGEYFRLDGRHNNITQHLIYPVPDPDSPFLGIHFTRLIDGGVTVGPNAVLGLHREGYSGRYSVRWPDAVSALSFPGLWRLLARHWRATLAETRNSLFQSYYLRECRKYCASLNLTDLNRYPPGIRAQAVMPDGTLPNDFIFSDTKRMTHVLNVPSPAATAALPIGRMIAERIHKEKMAVPVCQ